MSYIFYSTFFENQQLIILNILIQVFSTTYFNQIRVIALLHYWCHEEPGGVPDFIIFIYFVQLHKLNILFFIGFPKAYIFYLSFFDQFLLKIFLLMAQGSQFPGHRLNPCPLQWKHGVPTTGPSGLIYLIYGLPLPLEYKYHESSLLLLQQPEWYLAHSGIQLTSVNF